MKPTKIDEEFLRMARIQNNIIKYIMLPIVILISIVFFYSIWSHL